MLLGYPMSQKSHPSGEPLLMSHTCWLICQKWKSMFLAGFLKRIQENVVSIGVLLKDQVYPNLEVVPFVGKTCSSHARRSINFWVISHISQVFKKGINKFVAFYWKPQIKLKKLFYHICDLLFSAFCCLFWTRYQWTKMPPVMTVRSRSRRHWYGKSWESIGSSESQSHKLYHRLLLGSSSHLVSEL